MSNSHQTAEKMIVRRLYTIKQTIRKKKERKYAIMEKKADP
jgi:hypothetical protein